MKQELVLITGMSGSGKSVALHALEDAGYYCVDNLPPELLLPFVQLEQQQSASRVAIAMDVRSASSLPLVPAQLAHLRALDVNVRLLFWMRPPKFWCIVFRKLVDVTRCHAKTAPMSFATLNAIWSKRLNLNVNCWLSCAKSRM